ncbi:hypothetical protein JXI42_04935 [bacterium]|nr:hypothetical protein [bacterium]
MKKIRIAIGSNDGENIVPTHMGMAEYFYIYDLHENGESYFVGRRENTSPDEEGKHGMQKKMEACLEIFDDADVIMGRKISPNFINISAQTAFQPLVTDVDEISDIIIRALKKFDEIYELIEQRKAGDRTKDIPEI